MFPYLLWIEYCNPFQMGQNQGTYFNYGFSQLVEFENWRFHPRPIDDFRFLFFTLWQSTAENARTFPLFSRTYWHIWLLPSSTSYSYLVPQFMCDLSILISVTLELQRWEEVPPHSIEESFRILYVWTWLKLTISTCTFHFIAILYTTFSTRYGPLYLRANGMSVQKYLISNINFPNTLNHTTIHLLFVSFSDVCLSFFY